MAKPIPEIDPEVFLKALLAVSPADAEQVRDIADTKAKPDVERTEHAY